MNLSIAAAEKSDKKAILRFYRQQRYSARFLGDDVTYIARRDEQIIAAVIMSYKSSTPFLHAMLVCKTQRCQGIAQALLALLLPQFPELYCFCENDLAPFYQKFGFHQIQSNTLPHELRARFIAYQKKHALIANHYIRT